MTKRNRSLLGRRSAWDEAGKHNPLYYVATERNHWEIEDFFASGEAVLRRHVDPWLRTRKLDGRSSRAVEIGAGVGRLSRGLSNRFREVIALDIAPSMVAKARELNSDRPNLTFAVNSGHDLAAVASDSSDFVLCVWVFQHVPNLDTIDDYTREIARVLKTNGSFLVQIQSSRFPWPYGNVRNYLVASGAWTRLLDRFNRDSTLAAAFPGALLEVGKLREMCLRHHLRVVESVSDEAPAAHWVYGERATS